MQTQICSEKCLFKIIKAFKTNCVNNTNKPNKRKMNFANVTIKGKNMHTLS